MKLRHNSCGYLDASMHSLVFLNFSSSYLYQLDLGQRGGSMETMALRFGVSVCFLSPCLHSHLLEQELVDVTNCFGPLTYSNSTYVHQNPDSQFSTLEAMAMCHCHFDLHDKYCSVLEVGETYHSQLVAKIFGSMMVAHIVTMKTWFYPTSCPSVHG